MSENNPYQAPQSNLDVETRSFYPLKPDWDIGEVFKEAWQLTNGYKATFFGALLMYMGVTIVISIVMELLPKSISITIIAQVLIGLVSYPLYAGLMMLAIKRSVGEPVNAFMIFDYYPKTIPLFLLNVLVMLLTVIGFILLVIPGIYLMVAYILAMPLLVEKNLRIWDAMETSRTTINKCWFQLFGVLLLVVVLLSLGVLTLGIAWIWLLPFFNLTIGIIYRNLFGVGTAIQQK